MDELRANVLYHKPQLVCIVETWLSTDIIDNEIYLCDYQIQRLDRNRHGGGILMYTHCSLSYKILLQGGPHNLEFLPGYFCYNKTCKSHILYLSFLSAPFIPCFYF